METTCMPLPVISNPGTHLPPNLPAFEHRIASHCHSFCISLISSWNTEIMLKQSQFISILNFSKVTITKHFAKKKSCANVMLGYLWIQRGFDKSDHLRSLPPCDKLRINNHPKVRGRIGSCRDLKKGNSMLATWNLQDFMILVLQPKIFSKNSKNHLKGPSKIFEYTNMKLLETAGMTMEEADTVLPTEES